MPTLLHCVILPYYGAMTLWPPTRLWNHLIASDPGLVRLRMAARPTLAVTLATAILVGLAHLAGRPVTEIALGGLLAMTAPLVLREASARQRQITLLLLPIPAAIAFALGVALLPWPDVGKLAFLAVVVVTVLVQTYTPRAGAFGFVAFFAMFLAMFLHATPEAAVTQTLSMVVAVAVVWLVCFRLMPERPAWAVRHMLAALLRRTEEVLGDAERNHASGAPADHARLSGALVRLNEAALAAEDLLGRLDADGLSVLRRRLVDLELALTRVVGLFAASPDPSLRDRARLRLLRTRLRRGRWARHRLGGRRAVPASRNTSSLGRAVIELDRVAAAIAGTEAAASLQPVAAAAPPGALDWRMAVRAGAASGLAIIGGSMVSHDRWFWAVITTFVVFVGTRSRGDTIQKLMERMGGTVAGVAAGLGAAMLLQGHLALELITLVLGVFIAFYYFIFAYWMTMFCFTIVLGVLYASAGVAPEPLLLLRLDETAVGAAAGLIVAFLVLPRRTGDDVRTQGLVALRALGEVIRLSIHRMSGAPPGESVQAPVDALRRMDAALRDLRTAARPLAMRRWLLPGTRVSRATPALLACAHWARLLAARSEHISAPQAGMTSLLEQARRLEASVEALAAGVAEGRTGVGPMLPPRSEMAFPFTTSQRAVAAALDNLGQSLVLLDERLATGKIDAFVYPA